MLGRLALAVTLGAAATAHARPDALAAAQAALDGGRYAEAAAAAQKLGGSEAAGLAGEALLASGRYAEAQALLEAAVQRDPHALRARLQLGLVYRATGQRDRERAVWNTFYDDYEQGRIDKKSARDLTYVALAARGLGGWQDANDTFRDAVDADPKGKAGARANVEWAALFLEKYDAGHAEQCLDEALKVLPDDADAHALMARVKLEQGYDVAGADKALDAALQKNPRHTGALATRAELLVDDERYADAVAATAAIFKIDPEALRAHEVAAAARLLSGDTRGYEAERAHVLRVDPRASDFYHAVAEFLVKQHRYVEANQLEEQAVQLDPKNYVALAAYGTNLLRLGDDAGGVAALQRAWDGDPYNVRTYNLLNLFEQVIPKAYVLVEGKPVRWRVPKSEAPLIARYVQPMVAREWAELVQRYHFTPEGPVTVELYADPQHYAVRTVGLPGLEALGVTFGKVITGMSPAGGRFNWGMMLWHEVAHVFALQLSKARVPRWFTEGLSEYETARHDPTWTRRTHAELYRALADGKLPSVRELNEGFSHAKDVAHMVVAYHESAEVVSFLVRRFGFDCIVAALRQFAAGSPATDVLPKVTGVSIDELDRLFREDLRARLSAYAGTFFVRPSDYSDVDALKAELAAHPDDGRARGLYALALIKAHDGEEAQKLIDPDLKNPTPQTRREVILAGAQLALLRKDRAMAKFFFGGLVQSGGDGFDARLGLGQIAAAEDDVAEAEKELGLAKKLDPDRPEPYLELAKLYLKSREDDALAQLEQAARLDVMDGSITHTLVEKYAARQRWAKVVEWAPRALDVDLDDAALHKNYAEALAALGRKKDAQGELDAAYACEPDDKLRPQLDALRARLK